MEEASGVGSRVAWQPPKEGTEQAVNTTGCNLFAMPDKLSLKLVDIENPGDNFEDSGLLVVDARKALQDENDRLRKLLAERDFDLAILKKKWQEDRVAYTAGGALASDVAGSKIVELSRKVRDVTAELEREKMKTKQLLKALQDVENNPNHSKQYEHISGTSDEQTSVHNGNGESAALQEKLQAANNRLTEYRNLCLTLKKDLKVAQKNTVQSAGYRNNYKGEESSLTMHGPSSAPLLRPMGESLGGNTGKRLAWRSADSSFPSASDLNSKEPSMDDERSEEFQGRNEANSELEEIKLMCQEYRLVAQATQVEKEKLLELVAVMNKRLETSASHALQAEQRVQELQQKNVQLEKQLERATLELHPRPGGANRRDAKSLPFVPFSADRSSEDHKRRLGPVS